MLAGIRIIIEKEFRNTLLTDNESYIVGGGSIVFSLIMIGYLVKHFKK